jgi:hypothetical protein
MWGNMMGWGGGAMSGISHLLWWAFLIVGVVLLVGWLLRGAPAGDGDLEGALRTRRDRQDRVRRAPARSHLNRAGLSSGQIIQHTGGAASASFH